MSRLLTVFLHKSDFKLLRYDGPFLNDGFILTPITIPEQIGQSDRLLC